MKVRVNVKSLVDGEELINETVGEYALINGAHRLAYSHLSGNMITNNYLTATPLSLHLKREGRIFHRISRLFFVKCPILHMQANTSAVSILFGQFPPSNLL